MVRGRVRVRGRPRGPGPSAARSSANGTAPSASPNATTVCSSGQVAGQLHDHRRLLGAGEHRGRAAVAQHERQLLRGEHDVDRVHDRAGLERAVVGRPPTPTGSARTARPADPAARPRAASAAATRSLSASSSAKLSVRVAVTRARLSPNRAAAARRMSPGPSTCTSTSKCTQHSAPPAAPPHPNGRGGMSDGALIDHHGTMGGVTSRDVAYAPIVRLTSSPEYWSSANWMPTERSCLKFTSTMPSTPSSFSSQENR